MDRTADLYFAAYLIASGLTTVKAFDGPPGRREVIFDHTIDPRVLIAYHTTPEGRVLDVFKSLKQAAFNGG